MALREIDAQLFSAVKYRKAGSTRDQKYQPKEAVGTDRGHGGGTWHVYPNQGEPEGGGEGILWGRGPSRPAPPHMQVLIYSLAVLDARVTKWPQQ